MAKGDRVSVGAAIKHAQGIPAGRTGTPVGRRRVTGRVLSSKLMHERMQTEVEARAKDAVEKELKENEKLREQVASLTLQLAKLGKSESEGEPETKHIRHENRGE